MPGITSVAYADEGMSSWEDEHFAEKLNFNL